jgi:hypothetical protein
MTLDIDVLAREADWLVARTQRYLRRSSAKLEGAESDASDSRAMQRQVRSLRLTLQRLELYRAVIKSSRHSHAGLLPEYLQACGLLPSGRKRGWRRPEAGATAAEWEAARSLAGRLGL